MEFLNCYSLNCYSLNLLKSVFHVKCIKCCVEGLQWGDFRDKMSMRYHLFKKSPKKALLIADSQARYLTFGNINISSLPGATVDNVYQFVPPQGKNEIIVLFVGGNDIYSGYHPFCGYSTGSIRANRKPCKHIDNCCEKVVRNRYTPPPPRIPPETEIENFEDHELIRHLAVNQRLANASKEARWNFEGWPNRGLAEHVYSETHISDRDCVHFSEKGMSQIRVILKTKVFLRTLLDRTRTARTPKRVRVLLS